MMNDLTHANDTRLIWLNFGAGDPMPGWLNLDSSPLYLIPRFLHRIFDISRFSPRSKFFLTGDYRFHFFSANRRLPFGDGTVEMIYCSHVIEHMPAESLEYLFEEFYRILIDGGIARILAPDLETAAISCGKKEDEVFIDLGECLGTCPRALRSSRFRMMLEALYGFPSIHKTLIASGNLDGLFVKNGKWQIQKGLRYLESDMPADPLKSIESESRCIGSLIFELKKTSS